MSTILEVRNLTRDYRTPDKSVRALESVSLQADTGEMLIVRGPSGSGKSTLLLCCGALLSPSGGDVVLNGTNPYRYGPNRRARFRARNVGFVFQQFHLIPYMTVLGNVLTAGTEATDGTLRNRALLLLDRFGMRARIGHKPGELSVGERQRAALARAMLNDPPVLLADEPTGNLDPANARVVLDAMRAYAAGGKAVLMVTHDPRAAGPNDRVVYLDRGRLREQGASSDGRAAQRADGAE